MHDDATSRITALASLAGWTHATLVVLICRWLEQVGMAEQAYLYLSTIANEEGDPDPFDDYEDG